MLEIKFTDWLITQLTDTSKDLYFTYSHIRINRYSEPHALTAFMTNRLLTNDNYISIGKSIDK